MAKLSASKLWKNVRVQPVVVVAVIIMLIAAMATVMHAYSMRKAAGKVEETFLREAMAVEAFYDGSQATVADPTAGVVSRKLKPYVGAGMSMFFCSGSGADAAAVISQKSMFFQVTAADVTCDFTTVSNSDCTPLIERLTCTDRTIALPADRTVVTSSELSTTVGEPATSSDCNVFLFDGVYAFSKVALSTFGAAWRPPGQPENGPCYLVMPRADIVTMIMMLLRPCFVRGVNSQLYYIDYNETAKLGGQAPEGMSYTSWDDTSATAALRLIPVNNSAIDNGSSGKQALPVQMPPAKTDKPPQTLADVVPPSGSTRYPLVFFYLKYQGPNTAVGGMPSGASSLFCRIGAVVNATATDAGGAPLLTAKRNASATTISLAVNGVASAMTIPAIDSGVLVATRVANVVIAATFGATRCAVRRWNLPAAAWLSYKSNAFQSTGGSGCPDLDVARQIGLYSATSVPCLADIALRTAGLTNAPTSGASDIESVLTTQLGNTLDGTIPMLAGMFLTSTNGRYEAKYQADCNLVVWDTNSGMPVWNSQTRMTVSGVMPGTLTINPTTGVVMMTTSGGITVYWRSSKEAGRADLGGYKLILEDDGVLRVRSSYGNQVAWEGAKGDNGIPFLLSCVDAAVAYAAKHGREASYSKASGAWNHFVTFGQTAGYNWPGPPGPCDENAKGNGAVVKHGNTGTMSCNDYCHAATGGGDMGSCVSALDSGNGAVLGCDQVRGYSGAEVACECAR